MRTKQAIEALGGTQTKLANALGIDQSTVSGWKEFPPALRQLQIEALTAGRLRAEPDCDKYRVPSAGKSRRVAPAPQA